MPGAATRLPARGPPTPAAGRSRRAWRTCGTPSARPAARSDALRWRRPRFRVMTSGRCGRHLARAAAGWGSRSGSVADGAAPPCRRRRCGWRWCARATRTGAWRRTTSSGSWGLPPGPARPVGRRPTGCPPGPAPDRCWTAGLIGSGAEPSASGRRSVG